MKIDIPLHFGLNSATLLPAATKELYKLARALEDERLRRYKYTIEGHTCNLGEEASNLILSQKRAYAVTDFLTTETLLSPDQFMVKWYGESYPAIRNTDERARKKNRRVVIKNTLETVNADLQGRAAALQIIHFQNGQKEIIADGDTLPSGAQYSIVFKSAAKSFVYICQVDSNGKTELLFPNTAITRQTNPITPGITYQVPGNNELFYLDYSTGTEQLVLLTMQAPVDNPLLACSKVIRGKAGIAGLRGVGGIKSFPSGEYTATEGDNMHLCEIGPGGKMSGVKGTSGMRGVGGTARMSPSFGASEGNTSHRDRVCRGYILKRFFYHN